MMIRYNGILILGATLFLVACGDEPAESASVAADQAAAPQRASVPLTGENYQDLLDISAELHDWKPFSPVDGITDFSLPIIAQRRRVLGGLQARLERMEAGRSDVSMQVDYLTVRAELDEQEFILRVTRPWARDPTFYLSALLRMAFTELPADGGALARLQRNLRAVPPLLEQARSNLTDVAADNAALAIRSLTLSDGVENGYPYRESPPPGVIGWYDDLLGRADTQPELIADITAALESLRGFHEWLVAHQDEMNGLNGVGKQKLDWFVRNALLLPYTSDEMLTLAQREFERLWAFNVLERHQNRDLPEILLPTSRGEYQERLADIDGHIRSWLVEQEVISIPDYIPKDWREMGYNVPWIVRSAGPNFWEQVQFRNPVPDHLHAVIPGHRFDALVSARVDHPIRSRANFGARREGWAVYLEEGMMRAGVLANRPRERELIYIFGIWRATRTMGDIMNQRNEMTAAETADYWVEITPMLDPDVARKYAHVRPAPGHGLQYTIGAIQLFKLLADSQRQLGNDFVLREFHDEVMSKGKIPVSLIRYEMTGYDDEVQSFWDRQSLETLLGTEEVD